MTVHTYSDYEFSYAHGTWMGGWVTLNTGRVVYITANQDIEQDTTDYTLGSEENPFSWTAYNEMITNHEWEGGFVRHGQDIECFPAQEGSGGCGCGSGEGCGCGCGSGYWHILSGSSSVVIRGVAIEFSWGTGTSKEDVTISIDNVSDNGSASAEWDEEEDYKIIISCTRSGSTDTCGYTIPENYRA